MTTDTSDVIDYAGFKIPAFQDEGGYRARIRKPDGHHFTFGNALNNHFDTLVYLDMSAVIEQSRLIVDSGELK